MPSSRAVLADILEYKLDPTVAHSKIYAHGRLAKPTTEPVKKLEHKQEDVLPKVDKKLEKQKPADKQPEITVKHEVLTVKNVDVQVELKETVLETVEEKQKKKKEKDVPVETKKVEPEKENY